MTTRTETAPPSNAIAIVGMAGRFPGANSVAQFWRNLSGGTESIVTLSEEELLAAGVAPTAVANHSYVRRAALMDGIGEFDAEFFGFTPQAARTLDPQHRLFLQTAWHAFEDAGCDPAQSDTTVGVFGTSSASGYLLHNLMSHHDPDAIIGQGATFEMVNLSLHNDKDHLATRVSHQFNLRGPALSVQTACSSSLVAVHLACQAILSGECEMALAGGASIRVPHRVGYWHEPGSMVSASGHCRPFDVRSDGTIFGSGVGVVLLKPLQDAVDDGDRIHAVIRGSAINNDGATKMNYAAPNAVGQAEVIAEAHAVADIDAATVSYVETHGTGTPLGDPIELDGLRQAFEVSTAPRGGPCFVGSVKSNIGHLEVASGIAGLIKTVLCLQHREIPATLHYSAPNPDLHLERGPFVVRAEHGPWDSDGVRRAGVSSFGVGGTNAHLVLDEAPAGAAPRTSEQPGGPQVLLLSARTVEALNDSRSALAAELGEPDAPDLSDAAFTLAGRRTEPIRMAAVAGDAGQAAAVLATPEHDNVFVGEAVPDTTASDRVVFLFPGQGAQHVGMARGLYETQPVFAEHVDACAAGFGDELGVDLRAEIFDGSARTLERTDRAQPALFTVQYALAKLIGSFGVVPAAAAGHSIGEYAAATLAGVFDLPTAITAVSMRARLMHAAARGAMVAVASSPDAVAEHLTPDIDLATVNDPGSCVVAGSEDNIRAFTDRLAAQGIMARRVRTAHAFHSRLMDPVIPEFQALMSRLALHEPQLPLLSNITGAQLSTAQATDPTTWARQIRATVRFSDELDALLADPHRVLVEVGPGGTLTGSAMRHPRWSTGHRAVRLMRHHAQNRDDTETFLLALGQLWAAGIDVDWTPLAGRRAPRRVWLPGYPFARQQHWVEHNAGARRPAAAATDGGVPSGEPADPTPAATRAPQLQTTLSRIWSQCLGIDAIDGNANFFDIGGDSLIAISIAMTATHEGLDLTPQDLYDNPSVAALAAALAARYATGSLARQAPVDAAHPPVPPNIAYFLEHGLAQTDSWRMPLLLRLRADVGIEDLSAVLTAVTNQHDALRMQVVDTAGNLEQHIGDPQESIELATRTLAEQEPAEGADERQQVCAMLTEQIRAPQTGGPPLAATYVRGTADGPCYLAISLHAMVGDNTSRDILLTDIFTALGQRLAGHDIALPPVTTSWREWSQRCAALATHPAVLDSGDFWLQTATKPTLRLADPPNGTRPAPEDLARHATALTVAQTTEVDDARRRLRSTVEEILLTALARTVAATVGDGQVAVELAGAGRSVLQPDVDVHRTVGGFATVYPVALRCTAEHDPSVRQLVEQVHDTLNAVPHHGIGYGLLRYLYAPTARLLGAVAPADLYFSYAGTIPDLPSLPAEQAPVQLDPDTAMPTRETIPGLGHAVELRAYRSAGVLTLDWWYDTRRLQKTKAESLAEVFCHTLAELARAAIVEDEMDSAEQDLTLVDLSSAEA